HSRKIRSKHPGSSCGKPGGPGRQVHSVVPWRRTRYLPSGVDGQSRIVAFFVMKVGPALNASATLTASEGGCRWVAVWADAVATVASASNAISFIVEISRRLPVCRAMATDGLL